MTNARDNDTWLKDLRAGGAQRDAALADLHTLFLSVLPQGISRWKRTIIYREEVPHLPVDPDSIAPRHPSGIRVR